MQSIVIRQSRSGAATHATATEAAAEAPTGRPDWLPRSIKAAPGLSPGRGRGLFATTHIERGEIIDVACTIAVDAAQCKLLDTMHPIGDYYFEHPERPDYGLIIIGIPSLVNHHDQPNAKVRFSDGDDFGWLATLYALSDIGPGAEIFYNYNTPLWFENAR